MILTDMLIRKIDLFCHTDLNKTERETLAKDIKELIDDINECADVLEGE